MINRGLKRGETLGKNTSTKESRRYDDKTAFSPTYFCEAGQLGLKRLGIVIWEGSNGEIGELGIVGI